MTDTAPHPFDGDLSDPLANPLLDEWMKDHSPNAAYSWHDRDWSDRGREDGSHRRRWDLSALYSFAVPTEKALRLIASFGPVVEIGAGTGYWATLLRHRGCDVAAYDLLGEAFDEWFPTGQWGGVEKGGAEKAALHADRTLLIVWPPYDDPMALDALTAYRDAGGNRLVYVGEGWGGCTGDDAFHGVINGPDWTETHELAIPQWFGINDRLSAYERVTSGE